MTGGGRTAIVAVLVGFLAVLAAYTGLTLGGHDATGLVSAVVTLVGLTGLGVHVETRTKQQNRQLDQITRQTNGVLDDRIRSGATEAVKDVMRSIGHQIPGD